MSEFQNKRTTKKGDAGEAILRKYFEDRGCIVYKSLTDASHPVDFMVMTGRNRNFDKIILCEVKTKEVRVWDGIKESGFNTHSYNDYINIQKSLNLPLYVYFIDKQEKRIYGNSLNELMKPYKEVNETLYPRRFNNGSMDITLFSLNQMKTIVNLNDNQIKEIEQYSK